MKSGLRRTAILTLKLWTSDNFGLQSEPSHREELRTGSDYGVFIGIQNLLGLFRILMHTSNWAEKFGLRTGKFGLATENPRLRTGKSGLRTTVRTLARSRKNFGPDRTGKFGLRTGVRTFAQPRKNRTGPDWESPDFALSPNFRAAEQKKLRTGSDWGSSDKFGLRTTVRTFAPRRTSDWIGPWCFPWDSKPFWHFLNSNANFGLGREVRTSDWKIRTGD